MPSGFPHAADRDELAFFDAPLHAIEDVRMILFQPGVLLGELIAYLKSGRRPSEPMLDTVRGHLWRVSRTGHSHAESICAWPMALTFMAVEALAGFGQYAGERRARGFHGFGSLAVGVQRTLQCFGEL